MAARTIANALRSERDGAIESTPNSLASSLLSESECPQASHTHQSNASKPKDDSATLPTIVDTTLPIFRLPLELRYRIYDLLEPDNLAVRMELASGKSPQIRLATNTPICWVSSEIRGEVKASHAAQIQMGDILHRRSFSRETADVTVSMHRLHGPAMCPNGPRKVRSITARCSESIETKHCPVFTVHFIFDDSAVCDSLLSTYHQKRQHDNLLPDRGQVEAIDEAPSFAKQVAWKGFACYNQLWYCTQRTLDKGIARDVHFARSLPPHSDDPAIIFRF